MKQKTGVRCEGISPEILYALMIIDTIYRTTTATGCTVTSLTDGIHTPGSMHYKGRAVDLRTRGLHPNIVHDLAIKLREELGDEFDVVLEKDHLHVEFDPDTD